MTLISVYKSDGTCVGRCDARCYDAESPIYECDCICGGHNHGAGKKKAEENTQKLAIDWIENYRKKIGLRPGEGKSEIAPELFQLSLFK